MGSFNHRLIYFLLVDHLLTIEVNIFLFALLLQSLLRMSAFESILAGLEIRSTVSVFISIDIGVSQIERFGSIELIYIVGYESASGSHVHFLHCSHFIIVNRSSILLLLMLSMMLSAENSHHQSYH